MKKIIIVSSMLCILTCFSANAQISVQANFGEPGPAYGEAPIYGSAYPIYPTYGVEHARYHDQNDHGHGGQRRGGGHHR